MSVRATTWAFRQRVGSPMAKLVLLSLASTGIRLNSAVRLSEKAGPPHTLLATPTSFVAVVSRIGGAELTLRVGRVRLITWVMLATFAISAVVGFSSPSPFAAVAILCVVYSAAIQADSAALTAGAVNTSPAGHRGATLALHSTLGFSGSLFAPAAVSSVLDHAAPFPGSHMGSGGSSSARDILKG